MMLLADDWKDYELIDTGNGEKLERWGKYILRRPDPQIIWPIKDEKGLWKKADAHYHRSQSGGGRWEFKKKLPERWKISYQDLSFYIEPTGFKHTGLFPEQAVNWKWMIDKIRSASRKINVLNLFAYTGGATVACAYANASVCHVDAAKGMVQWAKENLALSGLADRSVRFITDDVIKFVQREKRRGRQYDAIIMDPPSYGRGPRGEIWKIEDALYGFVEECLDVLSPKPLFFLINSYTTGFSPTVICNILKMTVGKRFGGTVSCGEVGIPASSSGIVLPCGIYGRWEAQEK
ncbi:MAG TPA: class I SAM-dependent methyltransferase [Acetivibrio sp.]|nr:class I SAM-dependent methyltransferase [Acetivibrio sp.]HOM02017.1 class I SAM-dependent methyltransferase [Acetivibrio sp.]